MADQITDAITFLEKVVSEPEVTIKFIKRTDNTQRIMRLTLDFARIPAAKKPKSVNLKSILNHIKKSRILHVFDLDKKDWRSVPLDSIEWMTDSSNVIHRIKIPR